MSKSIKLPTIEDVDVNFLKDTEENPTTEQIASTYRHNQFVGDIYSNRGRFGGSANYWTIAENDLFASYETAGNLYFRAGKTNFADTSTVGFCWGIGDGEPKFIMGNATNYIDWNVTTANTLTISGTITATAGIIGGFTIGATTLTATNLILDSANQKITLGTGNNIIILDAANATYRIGVGNATLASCPFRVEKDGSVIATDITATGTIYATAGWAGSATALVYESQGINCGTDGHIRGGQTDYNTGTGFFLGYSGGAYKQSIGSTAQYFTWDGSTISVLGKLVLIETWTTGETLVSGDAVEVGRNETRLCAGDTYIDSVNNTTNYGGNDPIVVSGSAGQNVRALLQFTLTDLPAGNLTSATLYINRTDAVNDTEAFDIHRVTSTWAEMTVTWNTMPTFNVSASATFTRTGGAGWKSIDITTLVASWLAGTYTNYGLLIKRQSEAGGAQGISFSDRGGANDSYIILVFDTGKVFKATATNSTNTVRFLGFANEAKAADTSCKIQIAGRVTNLTGLTVGSAYYLSDTAGLISTTPGTVSKKVGLSGTSTTELILLNS